MGKPSLFQYMSPYTEQQSEKIRPMRNEMFVNNTARTDQIVRSY